MNKKNGNPILICEGRQEMVFATKISEIFVPGVNLFQLNASGNSKFETITNKIVDCVDIMEINDSPVIVIFDREKRKETPEQIIETIKEKLAKRGLDPNQVIIGVADPYIEAWMLPFVDTDGNYPVNTNESWEGMKCLGELERRLMNKNLPYKKLEIGVEILSEIDRQKLAEVSESFRNFYYQTKKVCNW